MTIELSLLLTLLGAVGSNVFTLWKNGREYRKERQEFLEQYAASKVQQNGHVRDVNHALRGAQQASESLKVLDDEYQGRFRELEKQLNELSGSFEVMRMIIERRRADD